tara:strand:- start:304 stop:1335 length:1032 start_codon:yes stop_codon:yes gene_type:complete
MANETGIQNLIRDYTTESSNSGSKSSLSGELPCVGSIVRYIATGSITAGQPVALKIPNNGIIKAEVATTSSTQSELLGISLQTVSDGDTVKILEEGYTTVSFQTASGAPETVALTNATNGGETNLLSNQPVLFTDSGDTGGNYANNEEYNYTFDAGAGQTVLIAFASMSFEHSTGNYGSRMYDRLGFQTGSDGTNYSNSNYSWMQKSDDDTPPYGSRFPSSGYWLSEGSSPGYVLPKDNARALLMPKGGYSGSAFFYDIGSRYVKFYFQSDSGTNKPGWQLVIKTSDETGDPPAVAAGAKLFIVNNGKISDTNISATTASIAKAITPSTSGSAVYAYINARGL